MFVIVVIWWWGFAVPKVGEYSEHLRKLDIPDGIIMAFVAHQVGEGEHAPQPYSAILGPR